MTAPFHVTSGDCAGELLARSGIPGSVFVWHDVLYDGPREPGWPNEATLCDRAEFLERETGGGLPRKAILPTLRDQYATLASLPPDGPVLLWFDACLFDQAMLAHVLTCLRHVGAQRVELLCIDAFPGVEPYHGLGQLTAPQLASRYGDRRAVGDAEYRFAEEVDAAFATQDAARFAALVRVIDAPLRWVPAAVARWLQERPDPASGLGRIEALALEAIRAGASTPAAVFAAVAARDTPPQFWGDTTLWGKINGLADRAPALVRIEGPQPRLPQWPGKVDLAQFRLLAG